MAKKESARDIKARVVHVLLARMTEYEVLFASGKRESMNHRATTAFNGLVRTLLDVVGPAELAKKDPEEQRVAAMRIFRDEYGITLPADWGTYTHQDPYEEGGG